MVVAIGVPGAGSSQKRGIHAALSGVRYANPPTYVIDGCRPGGGRDGGLMTISALALQP
ncbi:hypothetical protein PAN31117_03070 [Pandoraea anapnoica]|uniref:Uncharacterized protein n=1 Tax=Pandoraea anapnoica TaxID=2508301 RepID=A0A5E5A8I6_9BURK|nr:hypothetical protein [Pandoraea anapnoica]VVE68813.1 hypothetical protein PAN31117_03070 [Pandoraea anapnoica]